MTMLATLLVLALQKDPALAETEAKLNNLKITLDFKDAPLESVVDYLREIGDMNLFIDSKVTEKQIRVSLKVTEISLRSVFALALKPHDCGTYFKDGVLMIMTNPDIADRTVKMQIYDCRDILHPIQDFPGVDIQLAVDGSGIGPVVDGGGGDAGEIPIAELVRAHTGGKSWDENPKFSIALQNGLLVVKQTPEVHRQVVRLLDMLRRNK
jgi:type II secretory pathway component GspD/PulD (secretin)